MSEQTLEEYIQAFPSPVEALRALPFRSLYFPEVVTEFTNWRSEQQGWHDSAVILYQSNFIEDLFVWGPDAQKLFELSAVNRTDNLELNTAKQAIFTNPNGHFIGDVILARYIDWKGRELYDYCGDEFILKWIEFNIQKHKLDVEFEYNVNVGKRRATGALPAYYRYEIQGPNAYDVIEEATGAPVPPTKFFHIAEFTIAGHRVLGVRHGMAGQKGFELFGPWEDEAEVNAAILEAGKKHGLMEAGVFSYFSSSKESGWFGSPLPAFYDDSMAEFRAWAPASVASSLGGSFESPNIEDYYVTPHEIGYTPFIKNDNDYVGKEALEAMADHQQRQKVTLVWDADQVGELFADLGKPEKGLPPQLVIPVKAQYALDQYDRVLSTEGEPLGISMWPSYLAPARKYLSLAVIDAKFAEPGTEILVEWGDSHTFPRSDVEPHRNVRVRATVAPVPYDLYSRNEYRK
ncbi:MAG TPA: hypothetical protein VNT53_00175 [Pseudolysinimonas sp.]|nr:hypothetical protein [Pseudolysinimonas sp.]